MKSCPIIHRQVLFHTYSFSKIKKEKVENKNIIFLNLKSFQKFKSERTVWQPGQVYIFWWKLIGSVFNAVLLTRTLTQPYFFREIGRTWCHFKLTCQNFINFFGKYVRNGSRKGITNLVAISTYIFGLSKDKWWGQSTSPPPPNNNGARVNRLRLLVPYFCLRCAFVHLESVRDRCLGLLAR